MKNKRCRHFSPPGQPFWQVLDILLVDTARTIRYDKEKPQPLLPGVVTAIARAILDLIVGENCNNFLWELY